MHQTVAMQNLDIRVKNNKKDFKKKTVVMERTANPCADLYFPVLSWGWNHGCQS
jgi:hypothetical protein